MRVKTLIPPIIAILVVGAVALALSTSRGSSRQAPSGAVASGTVRLTIANYAFGPAVLTVRRRTTVLVTNTDSTAHTATARSGVFDSSTVKPGQSARFTLNKPGTYTYYCQFHAFMTGIIKVVG